MLQYERIKKILEYINQNRKANVAELSEKFNVSPVTIRRDIDSLAERGLVIKKHGVVISAQSKLSYEIPYYKKSNVNKDKKKQIGKFAAQTINDNDIIILDAGTTTLEVAKNIKSKNITVITNDLIIATEIASKGSIELIVVGGILEKGVYTLTGSRAVDFLKKLHVNKVFLGADAVDIDFGISNRSISEVALKLAMNNVADENIVVADSSKFHKKLFHNIIDLKEVDTLITDEHDLKIEEYMQKFGHKVFTTI